MEEKKGVLEMGHLNYFEPFERQNSKWENPLTRALLVTLKHSPLALSLFYDHIKNKYLQKAKGRCDLPSYNDFDLAQIDIDTQVGSLKNFEASRLLSVYITDDLSKNDIFQKELIIKNNSRRPVYDGVIRFSDEITVFIENKPDARDAWEEQMHPNLDDLENSFELLKTPALVEWKDIITIFNNLISSEVIGYAEKIIFTDFLEYCFKNFPELNPYDSLDLCSGNELLVDRRISKVLKNITVEEIDCNKHIGWCPTIEIGHPAIKLCGVQYINLTEQDYKLRINLIFGDTINQSRVFYSRVKNYDIINGLTQKGFYIDPCFHLSHMQKGLVWLDTTKTNILRYYEYWRDNICNVKQYSREDAKSFIAELDKNSLIKLDNELLQDKIWRHTYQKINICPALGIFYDIDRVTAENLDKEGVFGEFLREKILLGLSILEEDFKLFV